jgi:predicted transcriptional regulator
VRDEADMTDKQNETLSSTQLLRMTADVVAAFVANNSVPDGNLTSVIQTVHTAFSELNNGSATANEPQKPAVPIKRSITPDYIVCLEDGKKLKMLKRHLRTTYGMTPEEYRAKWGLPHDYPMVAPNYAKQRSEFAKQIGLGKTPGQRRGRGRARA